jgi:hypothetical protein
MTRRAGHAAGESFSSRCVALRCAALRCDDDGDDDDGSRSGSGSGSDGSHDEQQQQQQQQQQQSTPLSWLALGRNRVLSLLSSGTDASSLPTLVRAAVYSDDDRRTMRGLRGTLFTAWKEADRPEQGKPKRGSGADVAARDRKRGATRECAIRRGVVLVRGLAVDKSKQQERDIRAQPFLLLLGAGVGGNGDTKMQFEW